MSEQTNKPVEKKLSASERIQNLEQASASLFQANDNVVKDLAFVREAIRLLNNKVSAITKASVAGEELNDEVLNRIMIENNVEELAQKVQTLKQQGILVDEETVSDNAFVVGKELNDKGDVINPRLQFSVKSIKPETQAKIVGVKVGDTVTIQENLKFSVLESYKIQMPALANSETSGEETPAVSPEVVQETQAPTDANQPTNA